MIEEAHSKELSFVYVKSLFRRVSFFRFLFPSSFYPAHTVAPYGVRVRSVLMSFVINNLAL